MSICAPAARSGRPAGRGGAVDLAAIGHVVLVCAQRRGQSALQGGEDARRRVVQQRLDATHELGVAHAKPTRQPAIP